MLSAGGGSLSANLFQLHFDGLFGWTSGLDASSAVLKFFFS